MKKVLILGIATFLFFSFFLSASAQDEKSAILISCPVAVGSPVINPNPLTICPGYAATFSTVLGTFADGCGDSVKIEGVSPIGTFWLRQGDAAKSITFSSAGTFAYSASTYKNGILQGTSSGSVVVASTPACPTISEWGLIVLVALIISSAIFIMMKRRRKTTVAT